MVDAQNDNKKMTSFWNLKLPVICVIILGLLSIFQESSVRAEAWIETIPSANTASVPSKMPSLRDRLRGHSVGAHQGGVFSLRFNTLRQFGDAYFDGADIVEMDLHLSKDGIPVVFHDHTLDRWTWCEGPVSSKTLAELKECSFKWNSERIPTFEEVLQQVQGRMVVNAEFKVYEVIRPAIDLVRKYDAYSWVFFQTQKDPGKYSEARSYDQQVALLFAPVNRVALDWALGLNDDQLVVIEIQPNLRTPEVIQAIHSAHKWVLEDSWHFDHHYEFFGASCTETYEAGIDIAISNRPLSCRRQRDESFGMPLN